jgi:hypothetical protein
VTYKVICDGCGKEAIAPTNWKGVPFNPVGDDGMWFSRVKDGKVQHACSRKCLEKLGGIVFPF